MKKGFTLIEILIVVSVVVLMVVSISGIMSGVFNSQNKNEAIDKITQNGNWILNELKKNILNADGSGENGEKFSCQMGSYGSKIEITNTKNRERTIIACLDGGSEGLKIASISAETTGLNVGTTVFLFQNSSSGAVLSDCSEFVTCSTLPSLQLSEVKFKFNLESGNSELSERKVDKDFFIDVTLRN